MAVTRNFHRLIVLTATLIVAQAAGSKYRSESFTCRLLNANYISFRPWLEYPIVFEPIVRGRLTIWSGISGLAGSEFKCYAGKNGTNTILLDFANFADKLEWTYFGLLTNLMTPHLSTNPYIDVNKGLTFHGLSVNHRENIVYKLQLDNRQSEGPLDCNRITKIEFQYPEENEPNISSACRDCRSSIIPIINSQISELFKSRLDEQIMDGLYWHLTQIISSQHFSGPIAL